MYVGPLGRLGMGKIFHLQRGRLAEPLKEGDGDMAGVHVLVDEGFVKLQDFGLGAGAPAKFRMGLVPSHPELQKFRDEDVKVPSFPTPAPGYVSGGRLTCQGCRKSSRSYVAKPSAS